MLHWWRWYVFGRGRSRISRVVPCPVNKAETNLTRRRESLISYDDALVPGTHPVWTFYISMQVSETRNCVQRCAYSHLQATRLSMRVRADITTLASSSRLVERAHRLLLLTRLHRLVPSRLYVSSTRWASLDISPSHPTRDVFPPIPSAAPSWMAWAPILARLGTNVALPSRSILLDAQAGPVQSSSPRPPKLKCQRIPRVSSPVECFTTSQAA